MSETPPFLRKAVVDFLATQDCIAQGTEKESCVLVFYKDKSNGIPSLTFLGTLDFSNPSEFKFGLEHSEDTSKANECARKLTGGMERPVVLF